MEQRGGLLKQEGARRGRLGLKASEVGLIPLVVAIDELRALVAAGAKKQRSWCFTAPK